MLVLNINKPEVIIGLLIGGFLPFLFSALTMRAMVKYPAPVTDMLARGSARWAS